MEGHFFTQGRGDDVLESERVESGDKRRRTLSNFPVLNANIVKNSRLDPNSGRLYIFWIFSLSVRVRISSTRSPNKYAASP